LAFRITAIRDATEKFNMGAHVQLHTFRDETASEVGSKLLALYWFWCAQT